MKKDEAKKLLPLIEAYANGKTIQIRKHFSYIDLKEPSFNDRAENYRIKPD